MVFQKRLRLNEVENSKGSIAAVFAKFRDTENIFEKEFQRLVW
jgi:hypothetical protein